MRSAGFSGCQIINLSKKQPQGLPFPTNHILEYHIAAIYFVMLRNFMADRITTPSELARLDYDMSSLSQRDRDRVLEADPNGGRCLVTNSELALNFCHCIPRSTMKQEEIVRVYRIHLSTF